MSIRSGERMIMEEIYRWFEEYQVSFWIGFKYLKDFSAKVNLYSYSRFK